MRNALYLMLLLASLCSCTTREVCDSDLQPDLVAHFKTMGSGTSADTTLTGLSIHGIREGRSDSLLVDSITTRSIALPPDPGNDSSRFVFSVNGEADTLVIHYQRESYLISYTCGFGMRYTLQTIQASGPMILDTEIRKAIINGELNQDEAHLWIFF